MNSVGVLQAMDEQSIVDREKDMQSGKKWRPRPTSLGEAKDYAYREDRNLETFVREKRSLTDPTKAHLPLVSLKSITKYA